MSNTNTTTRAKVGGTVPVLAALAAGLGTLVAVRAFAQLGGPAGTRSGMISAVSGYSLMTSDAGADDIILVLDNRNEELMVYRTEGQAIQLHQKVPLPRLFTEARARNQGRN